MKVAFTSSGETMQSPMDGRFGRARNFIVVDMDDGSFEVVSNERNSNASSGAGVQAAQNVADAGAEALVTRHCGPKAFRVLAQAGIKVYSSEAADVAEAKRQFEAGELEPVSGPNVEGHWI